MDADQTLSYAASGLLPGISFNAATRTFSGIFTAAGTFAVSVIATDDGSPANMSAIASFTFTVNKAALSITANNAERNYGEANPPLSGTLVGVVNNDKIPATYAHHGVYAVTLTVTDSHLASASDTLSVTVTSAFGCASDALNRLKPFVKQSQRLEKVVKDLTASLEPKLWVDEVHLNSKEGGKARIVSRTLYAEKEHLVAVNAKNQKSVDAELKRAKDDLAKGAAAETAKDFDKALTYYASAWEATVKAIGQAANAR